MNICQIKKENCNLFVQQNYKFYLYSNNKMYKIKTLFKKSKNIEVLPLDEMLDSAKRSQIVYKTPDELEDIINEIEEYYLSSFIKTELNNTFVYYISDRKNKR